MKHKIIELLNQLEELTSDDVHVEIVHKYKWQGLTETTILGIDTEQLDEKFSEELSKLMRARMGAIVKEIKLLLKEQT